VRSYNAIGKQVSRRSAVHAMNLRTQLGLVEPLPMLDRKIEIFAKNLHLHSHYCGFDPDIAAEHTIF
jgi:hypothetical protein